MDPSNVELKDRVARLEALIGVLLIAEASGTFPEDLERILRHLVRRPPGPPDFHWEELLHLLHRAEPRKAYSELSGRLEKLESSVQDARGAFEQRVSAFEQRTAPIQRLESWIQTTEKEALPGMRAELAKVAQKQATVQVEQHEYFVALTLGLDVGQLPLPRYIPVQVYAAQERPRAIKQLTDALSTYLASLGFEVADDFPPERGSWYKRWIARAKSLLTNKETQERLQKLERALQVAILEKPQAEADKLEAEGAAALIQAVAAAPDAICRVGSIVVLKVTGQDGKPKLVVQTLTPTEMIEAEKNKSLLRSPLQLLEMLSKQRVEITPVPDGSPQPVIDPPSFVPPLGTSGGGVSDVREKEVVMPRLMILCPRTKKPIPTGMVFSKEALDNSKLENNSVQCVACGQMHTWNKPDAFLEGAR